MDVIHARLDIKNPTTDITILFVYNVTSCYSKICIKSRRNFGGYFSTQVPGCSWRIIGDPGIETELDAINKTLYIPTDSRVDTSLLCKRGDLHYFVNSINKHIKEIADSWEGTIAWEKNF